MSTRGALGKVARVWRGKGDLTWSRAAPPSISQVGGGAVRASSSNNSRVASGLDSRASSGQPLCGSDPNFPQVVGRVGSNPPLPSDSSSRLVRPQRLRSMTTSSSAMPAEFQHQAPEHGHVRRDPHGTVTPARPSSPTPPTREAASLPLDRAGSCAFATCRVLRVAEGCPRRVPPVQGAPAAGPRGLDRRLESASGRRTRRARARDADGRLGRRVGVSSDSPDA